MRLTTGINMTTTTKPRARARYVDWSTIFQESNFPRQNLPKPFVMPDNISDYTHWVRRQKRVS